MKFKHQMEISKTSGAFLYIIFKNNRVIEELKIL